MHPFVMVRQFWQIRRISADGLGDSPVDASQDAVGSSAMPAWAPTPSRSAASMASSSPGNRASRSSRRSRTKLRVPSCRPRMTPAARGSPGRRAGGGRFDLRVVAPSLLAHAALPHLRRSRGAIVNVSSTYGHRPDPGATHHGASKAYGASKAALEQLARSCSTRLPGSRWAGALNPKRSPSGSCAWPTPAPPGSPARSSPSTAGRNSYDPWSTRPQRSPPSKTQPTVAPLPMLTTPTAGSVPARTKPPP